AATVHRWSRTAAERPAGSGPLPRRGCPSANSLRTTRADGTTLQGGRMTARRLLWLVLGTVGLPLLIEGSNGCGFHSSAASPIDDNAYTCGCRCDAAPVTKTVTIAPNSADAE